MTNQLSASSGPNSSRHFVKERATRAQSIVRSRDTQSTRLWIKQVYWISKNSIDVDAQI